MYQQNHTIKSWAEEDRPREKLLLKGKAALSDAELLAILLGSGTRELTAVELARQLLQLAQNNLISLGQLSIEDLMVLKGIGEAKAVTIAAALELGRRRQQSTAIERKFIRRGRDTFELLSPILADLPHEEFWVIFLNRQNAIIGQKCVSVGGTASTIVDPKIIFRMALQEKASAIILAHNHPSGNLKPSDSDKRITRILVESGRIIDLLVLDHVIISQDGFYSFADNGNL